MSRTLYWENDSLFVLNQLLLPGTIKYIRCRSASAVAATIRDMAIRGAPAIGVAAAFGVALAARERKFTNGAQMQNYIDAAIAELGATRPTAVNLFWALSRMKAIADAVPITDIPAVQKLLMDEALAVYEQDIAINKKMGDYGAKLLKKNVKILTHCNAGALATAGYGTALGVIRSAHRQGKVQMVFVDETRPYLQGARLTAWEMKQEKIPYTLITDNMAGHIMKTEGVGAVIVGADRIAANGDTANKIGTYSLSILAKYHHIPFYIAAPLSTIDFKTKTGAGIVIEERSTDEVVYINRKSIAPAGTVARHPGFDVTPAANITAIITERGVFDPHDIKQLKSTIRG